MTLLMRDQENEEKGIKKGITQGITQERIAAIERMIRAGFAKEQIILCGYMKDEIEKAENALYENV